VSALFTQCPGGTVQTGTKKVDPARKFKCTMAAREMFMQTVIFKSTRNLLEPHELAFVGLWLHTNIR